MAACQQAGVYHLCGKSIPAAMPAGLSGRILAGLAFLAAIHAAAHAELLPVPFWVLVVVISMVLIYVGSLYSLAVSTYADEVVRMPWALDGRHVPRRSRRKSPMLARTAF